MDDDEDLDEHGFENSDCSVCGIPLTPRSVVLDGHLALEGYCPDHGVQKTVTL